MSNFSFYVQTSVVMHPIVKRVQICNIPVDALTMQETVQIIDEAIHEKRSIHHVVINAAKVVNAQRDPELKNSIINCDIINADGSSIVWASKLLKQPVPERVAGIDLMETLVELSSKRNYRIFFLGAKEDVVNKVVRKYEQVYGKSIIAGYRNGYYTKDEEPLIALQIAESHADILFVAITSPKKEIFLNTYKHIIKVPFIMGVGGSFDVVSGLIKRAPLWMQKSGLEWFYRVIQEPGRMWKRYLTTNSAFIYLVLKEKLSFK
jgi:N-acetylglucosaminyldiphosphoundecaprenol N-acetyl-beta-D-mannosaminyltransferase